MDSKAHDRKVIEMKEMPRARNFDLMLQSFFSGIDLEKLLIPGRKVLEIGCGRANTIRQFAQKYGIQAYGLDLADFTKSGKPEYRGVDLNFVQGDALNLPFKKNFFDFVFSHYTFQYLADKLKGLREAHRVLKLGGVGVIDFGRLNVDNETSGGEFLYDAEISPSLAEIISDPKYANSGQLQSERVNIFDKDQKGKFQDRRANRVTILKTQPTPLKFPELVRTEEKYSGIWPFVHCTYAK